MRRRWSIFLFVLLPLVSYAQFDQNRLNSSRSAARGAAGSNISSSNTTNTNKPFVNDTSYRGDTNAIKGLQYVTETPDSILRKKVFLFFYSTTRVKIDELWNPTLDPTGVQFNDNIDALNGDYYLGKGMIGHQHVSIMPKIGNGLRIELQPDVNFGYSKYRDNVRFYQTMTPYTVLSYNSSIDKDYLVHVSHTQNIMPGWNAKFDYQLIRPEGVYTSSGAKNHYFDFTTNYFSRDSRLQAMGGIIWQSLRIDENDGISNDSIFTRKTISNRAGVPVNLYEMGSKYNEIKTFGKAIYNLVRQTEKLVYHDNIVARIVNDTVTKFDTIEVADTIPLHNPKMLNLGVIGIEVNYEQLSRKFVDSTSFHNIDASIYWTNDAYPDYCYRNPMKLTFGIKPHLVKATMQSQDLQLQSWIDPFGRAELTMGRVTLIGEGDVHGSFNANGIPDSRYSSILRFDFDTLRQSNATISAVAQTKMPCLRMIHDAGSINLKPISSESYSLSIKFRDIVNFSIQANHLSHNTWYDSLMTVYQGSSAFWLYQTTLSVRLKVGFIHLDMQQILQRSTDSIQMPVPLWASKNSFYADFKMFGGTLRAQAGVDVRYHTIFYAPGYDPYSGLFYHQDVIKIGNYIWADIFINLQVKRASLFVKAGHLNAIWEENPNYFTLPHYPGRKFGLYWGITWHFFD